MQTPCASALALSGGEALVACQPPARRSAPRELLAELLPSALDHHLVDDAPF